MNPFLELFQRLYFPIGTAVCVGIALSFLLTQPFVQRRSKYPLHRLIPAYLGKFLFLLGVPIGVVNFIRKADLSGTLWISPLVAWLAIALGVLCAWLWLWPHSRKAGYPDNRSALASRGSFTLVSMVGNTSYLGFPVILLLPQLGPDYFGWALLYDVLGTFFGAYGLGVILAARASAKSSTSIQASNNLEEEAINTVEVRSFWRITQEVLKNPTIFAFLIGLALRRVAFPDWLDLGLSTCAWSVIMLALVLMGIRLQQLDSWQSLRSALPAVGIKMFLVPLIVALILTCLGMEGPPRLVLILQSAMPSAFATLVLAETYNLDRDLVVTALGLSSSLLLIMLPFWLWGFATW